MISRASALGIGAALVLFGSALLALAMADGAWRAGALALLLPVAGLFWLSVVYTRQRSGSQSLRAMARRWPAARFLWPGLALGLFIRLALIGSPTLFEDDYLRYLWDGGVTAAGHNPYARSPASVLLEIHPILPPLSGRAKPLSDEAQLGVRSGGVLENVSYPSVTTIYPPLAELGFAAAHILSPWSLIGWRVVVLAAEGVCVALLIGALHTRGMSPLWALGYWLCPIVIKEFSNGAHMDALLMPALAGLCWAVLAGRLRLAAALVGVAAGLKLWPLLLVAGLVWRAPRWRERGLLAAISLLSSAALLAPQLLSLSPANSGLVAYAESWVRNSLAFPALLGACNLLVPEAEAGGLARLAVAAITGGFALHWARAAARGGAIATIGAWRDTVLLLLLLSPTGYSWYATWLVPFFIFAPSLPSGLLVAFVGSYYARFADPAGAQGLVTVVLAPLIGFGPAWAALITSAVQRQITAFRP